jgi:acyl carrier protein
MTAVLHRPGEILAQLSAAMPHLSARLRPELPIRALIADSLDAVELLIVLKGEFGVAPDPERFRSLRTVADLETLVAELLSREGTADEEGRAES